MTVPQASPEDLQEQAQSLLDEPPTGDGELPDEAPEADVAEQRAEVAFDEEDAPIG
jgi:hypothetical protein